MKTLLMTSLGGGQITHPAAPLARPVAVTATIPQSTFGSQTYHPVLQQAQAPHTQQNLSGINPFINGNTNSGTGQGIGNLISKLGSILGSGAETIGSDLLDRFPFFLPNFLFGSGSSLKG